jgi:hypothetical protein
MPTSRQPPQQPLAAVSFQDTAFVAAMDAFLKALTVSLGSGDGTGAGPTVVRRVSSLQVVVNHGSGLSLTWVAPWPCYAVYAVGLAGGDVTIATTSVSVTIPGGVLFNPSVICHLMSGRFCEMRHFVEAGQTIWFNSSSTGMKETLELELA